MQVHLMNEQTHAQQPHHLRHHLFRPRQIGVSGLMDAYLKGNVALATVIDNKVEVVDVNILIDTVQGAWITGIPEQTNIIVGGQGFVNEGDEVISKFK